MGRFRNILFLFFLIGKICPQIIFADSQTQQLPIVTLDVGLYAQWKPTTQQIKEAETALSPAFTAAAKKIGDVPFKPKDLSHYGRQYLGKVQSQRQFIEVIGFCNALGKSQSELLREPMYVEDGGACFFYGEYAPDKKVFDNFYFNGDA